MNDLKKVMTIFLLINVMMSFTACKKKDKPIEETEVTSEQTQIETVDIATEITTEAVIETIVSYIKDDTTNSDETVAGGGAVIINYEITVSDNKYIYEHKEISFDEIKDLLKDADENIIVILYDEMASDSAFSTIKSFLESKGISYSIE